MCERCNSIPQPLAAAAAVIYDRLHEQLVAEVSYAEAVETREAAVADMARGHADVTYKRVLAALVDLPLLDHDLVPHLTMEVHGILAQWPFFRRMREPSGGDVSILRERMSFLQKTILRRAEQYRRVAEGRAHHSGGSHGMEVA